jgi:RNA polymerase sigma-70 factor, ECF subfamily
MPIAMDHDPCRHAIRRHAGRSSLPSEDNGSGASRTPDDNGAGTGAPAMTVTGAGLGQLEDPGGPGPGGPMEMIYRLHGRRLYRFLLRVTLGDRREAEDLLQETLFRAWRYLQSHAADVEQLAPWLYTVARRVAIDAARARQARPAAAAAADVEALPAAQDDIERLVVKLTIRSALMTLTREHRQVLIEVFYYGRSAREAGEALGIPEGTVKSRTFYALRALATSVAGAEGEPGTLPCHRRKPSSGAVTVAEPAVIPRTAAPAGSPAEEAARLSARAGRGRRACDMLTVNHVTQLTG